MKVTPIQVSVRELTRDYQVDTSTNQVTGYGGALDIRPKYQRNFVYKPHQQEAVIDTVIHEMPLSIMYWAVTATDPDTGEPSAFEILDGQQRTLSLCAYLNGDFSYTEAGSKNPKGWKNLSAEQQQAILDYEITVYLCQGDDDEKLAWFQRINIAGEQLTDQELRNAVYAGPWLEDAKETFSNPASTFNARYAGKEGFFKGDANRQEILETVLKWRAHAENQVSKKAGGAPSTTIESYMASYQHEANAADLIQYANAVCTWVESTFIADPKKDHYAAMRSLPWGEYFNLYSAALSGVSKRETVARIHALMGDEEVTKKNGIWLYLLTNDTRYLSLRGFSPAQKETLYAQQNKHCAAPGYTNHDPDQTFDLAEMQADHITPWSKGGKTDLDNGQMLCAACNRAKSGM